MATRKRPVGRSRPTRSETRGRVLAAAAGVFAEHGFNDASLAQIATEAGLTKGAIFSSFASKDELFAALISKQVTERLERVADAAEQIAPADARELVRSAGQALTDSTIGDPAWHVMFIEFWTRAMRNPRSRQILAHQREAARNAIALYLDKQATALDIPLPMTSQRLALVVLALSNGLAIEQLLDPQHIDRSLMPDVLEILFET